MRVMGPRGWWNMRCWNALSEAQQDRLIEVGNLPFGFEYEGDCPNSAEVAVESMYDRAPGPRFYCMECASVAVTLIRPPGYVPA